MPAGRPSELTEELLVKIKDGVFEGKNYLEICKDIEIPYDTFMGWKKRNYDRFSDTLLVYEEAYRISRAERNIDEFLDMETFNEGVTKKGDTFTFDDPKLKKIKFDASTFVLETREKGRYSKRTETTGKDGEPIKHDLNVTKAVEIAKKYEEELKKEL